MTNEEAIKDIQDNILPVVGGKSLLMAIEALKAQNGTDTNVGSNDLISRQTLQKELALYPIDDVTSEDEAGYNRAINDIQKMVLHLPSAQPEPIKVSVDREMTEEELKELKKKIADSPVVLLPSAQPEIKPVDIDYYYCSNAMLKMWIDNVLTDGEYNRIMDKLNDFERKRLEKENG